MRHVQEKSQIMYYYCKDEENIGFEKLCKSRGYMFRASRYQGNRF